MAIGKIIFESFDKKVQAGLLEAAMKATKCRENRALSFIYGEIERLSAEDLQSKIESRPGISIAEMPARIQQFLQETFGTKDSVKAR